jgi:hypothetical protein
MNDDALVLEPGQKPRARAGSAFARPVTCRCGERFLEALASYPSRPMEPDDVLRWYVGGTPPVTSAGGAGVRQGLPARAAIAA